MIDMKKLISYREYEKQNLKTKLSRIFFLQNEQINAKYRSRSVHNLMVILAKLFVIQEFSVIPTVVVNENITFVL